LYAELENDDDDVDVGWLAGWCKDTAAAAAASSEIVCCSISGLGKC